MSLQYHIDEVQRKNPLWKSISRILGRGAEEYCLKNIKCRNCNSLNWEECSINEKSKDLICKKCGKKYQIKCKKITKNKYENIKKNNEFETIGAEYNTTLKSINEEIDYIIILYEKVKYMILGIIHINSNDITSKNIKPRNPLGINAKRAGWQGCNLYFTNINFIN